MNKNIPSKNEFVSHIGSKLYQQKIAEYIYNILFDKGLTQLNQQEIRVLSTLLNDENPNNSQKILQIIKETFPKTEQAITKIQEHRKFFPLSLLNTSTYIQDIQQTIFSLFDNTQQENMTKLAENTIRNTTLHIIKKNLGEESYQKCKKNFSIKKYIPEEKSNTLYLETTSKNYYNRFEEQILPYYISACKQYKIPKCKLKYIVNPNIHRKKETIPQNKEKITINSPINPDIQRTNCYIPDKEKIYQTITNPTSNRHIFIHAETGKGKTHLIQAIYHKLKAEHPKQKIIYITAQDFYHKYIESANKDRKYRERMINKNHAFLHTNNLKHAFHQSSYIFIDDIENIQGNKKATQHLLQQIIKQTGAKLIMTSSLSIKDITFNQKIQLSNQEGYDYQIKTITEIFTPLVIKLQDIPKHQKKEIAQRFLKRNLFNKNTNEGIITLLIEKNIPLNLFESILESIEFNYDGNAKSAFQIIQDMTGTVIKPYHNELLQIILDCFTHEDIQKFINIKETGGFPKSENIRDFGDIKGNLINKTDGIMLRTAIYFIKKYYPKQSFNEIGIKFSKSASNISSLYKESKEYLHDNPNIEKHFETKIQNFLQKKYGLKEK